CVVFFFSSRRRHTRFSRDWSSDVCSSDLAVIRAGEDDDGRIGVVAQRRTDLFRAPPGWQQWIAPSENRQEGAAYASERLQRVERSEERRVGKAGAEQGSRRERTRKGSSLT